MLAYWRLLSRVAAREHPVWLMDSKRNHWSPPRRDCFSGSEISAESRVSLISCSTCALTAPALDTGVRSASIAITSTRNRESAEFWKNDPLKSSMETRSRSESLRGCSIACWNTRSNRSCGTPRKPDMLTDAKRGCGSDPYSITP